MSAEYKFKFTLLLPLDVSWKVYKAENQLLPKLMPALYAKIDVLQGDGGAGTIRAVTLGEGAGPKAAGHMAKEQVTFSDKVTYTEKYSVIEGLDPRYIDLRFDVQFTAVGDSTIMEWTALYTPVTSNVPAPTHMESLAEASLKVMEAYAKEHPSEFA